jgi:hypothetical protein
LAERARPSIVKAAERLVGAQVDDAVLLVANRRQFALVAGVLIVPACLLGLRFGTSAVIAGGVVIGGLASLLTSPRFLIGARNGMFLATSRRFPTARPLSLIRQVYATEVRFGRQMINIEVIVGSEKHVISRIFETRLYEILSRASAIAPPDVPPGYQPYRG